MEIPETLTIEGTMGSIVDTGDGVIEPCVSPQNAPLLLVPKKNKDTNGKRQNRVCIDYRGLNEVIEQDHTGYGRSAREDQIIYVYGLVPRLLPSGIGGGQPAVDGIRDSRWGVLPADQDADRAQHQPRSIQSDYGVAAQLLNC